MRFSDQWGIVFIFNKFKACLSCMIPFFLAMRAQGRVLLSLSASFLEAGGVPFKILDLVGQSLTIATKFSLVAARLVLFATSFLSTDFSLNTAAARLLKYLRRVFMPSLLMPGFVSTSCAVSTLVIEFAAPNLIEPSLASALHTIWRAPSCTLPFMRIKFCWPRRDPPSHHLSAEIFPW